MEEMNELERAMTIDDWRRSTEYWRDRFETARARGIELELVLKDLGLIAESYVNNIVSANTD